ncbi:uncharacterized protein EV420DRAFT_1556069, partial [Desarmillaria tabescens]
MQPATISSPVSDKAPAFATSSVLVSIGAQGSVLFAITVILVYPMNCTVRACPSANSWFCGSMVWHLSESVVADCGVCTWSWWVSVRGWQASLFYEVVNFCFLTLCELLLGWFATFGILWCVR